MNSCAIRAAKKSVVVRCNTTPFDLDFPPFAVIHFGKHHFDGMLAHDCPLPQLAPCAAASFSLRALRDLCGDFRFCEKFVRKSFKFRFYAKHSGVGWQCVSFSTRGRASTFRLGDARAIRLNSRIFCGLWTLCVLFKTQVLSFQQIPDSFCKTPGVGIPPEFPSTESTTSRLFSCKSFD